MIELTLAVIFYVFAIHIVPIDLQYLMEHLDISVTINVYIHITFEEQKNYKLIVIINRINQVCFG